MSVERVEETDRPSVQDDIEGYEESIASCEKDDPLCKHNGRNVRIT